MTSAPDRSAPKRPAPRDPYEAITARLLRHMAEGTMPWVQPWAHGGHGGLPVNGTTGRAYQGVNVLTLWLAGYPSPRWYTYRQAQAQGGQVRKGERGCPILFFKMREREDPTTGETRSIPLARTSTVFNEGQIEWDGRAAEGPGAPRTYLAPSEVIVLSGAEVRHGGDVACYSVSLDVITLPPFASFDSEAAYWATALHELVHWSGAPHRLNRDLAAGQSDLHAYAFEELVAEIGSAFLCARLGVPGREAHAGAYLQHWMEIGRQDTRAFARAARLAQTAADALLAGPPLGPSPTVEDGAETSAPEREATGAHALVS